MKEMIKSDYNIMYLNNVPNIDISRKGDVSSHSSFKKEGKPLQTDTTFNLQKFTTSDKEWW